MEDKKGVLSIPSHSDANDTTNDRFYASTNSKIADSAMGFIATFAATYLYSLLCGLLNGLLTLILQPLIASETGIPQTWSILTVLPIIAIGIETLLFIGIAVFFIVLFKRRSRRFISLGIIMALVASILLPLLLLGACFVLITASSSPSII